MSEFIYLFVFWNSSELPKSLYLSLSLLTPTLHKSCPFGWRKKLEISGKKQLISKTESHPMVLFGTAVISRLLCSSWIQHQQTNCGLRSTSSNPQLLLNNTFVMALRLIMFSIIFTFIFSVMVTKKTKVHPVTTHEATFGLFVWSWSSVHSAEIQQLLQLASLNECFLACCVNVRGQKNRF